MGSGLSLGSVLGVSAIQVLPVALQILELLLQRSTEACVGSCGALWQNRSASLRACSGAWHVSELMRGHHDWGKDSRGLYNVVLGQGCGSVRGRILGHAL